MRWLILLLPWVELYTLIQLGGRIGALGAVFYVFVTLVLGVSILRLQGMEILGRMRDVQRGGLVMGRFFADDLAVGFAGLLLMIPGLITDAMAVLVLIGPLWRRLSRATPGAGAPGAGPAGGPGRSDSLDGTFRESPERSTRGATGRGRHETAAE